MGVGQAVEGAVPQPDDAVLVLEGLVAPLGEDLFEHSHPPGLAPAGGPAINLSGDLAAEGLGRFAQRRPRPTGGIGLHRVGEDLRRQLVVPGRQADVELPGRPPVQLGRPTGPRPGPARPPGEGDLEETVFHHAIEVIGGQGTAQAGGGRRLVPTGGLRLLAHELVEGAAAGIRQAANAGDDVPLWLLLGSVPMTPILKQIAAVELEAAESLVRTEWKRDQAGSIRQLRLI